MTSVFSWQNFISLCLASFCTPRPHLPIIPGKWNISLGMEYINISMEYINISLDFLLLHSRRWKE